VKPPVDHSFPLFRSKEMTPPHFPFLVDIYFRLSPFFWVQQQRRRDAPPPPCRPCIPFSFQKTAGCAFLQFSKANEEAVSCPPPCLFKGSFFLRTCAVISYSSQIDTSLYDSLIFFPPPPLPLSPFPPKCRHRGPQPPPHPLNRRGFPLPRRLLPTRQFLPQTHSPQEGRFSFTCRLMSRFFPPPQPPFLYSPFVKLRDTLSCHYRTLLFWSFPFPPFHPPCTIRRPLSPPPLSRKPEGQVLPFPEQNHYPLSLCSLRCLLIFSYSV